MKTSLQVTRSAPRILISSSKEFASKITGIRKEVAYYGLLRFPRELASGSVVGMGKYHRRH